MWKIIPREEKFFDMFNTMAENANDTAALLVEMMESFDRLQERAFAIKGKEHLGDSQIHDLITRLNSTFITPMDREDIHQLASAIDDIIDLADAAANKVVIFDHHEKIAAAPELARVLRLQTQELAKAVRGLPKQDRTLESCIEVHRLENEADRIFQEAIRKLFREEKDPIQLIKIKEILESIERATDTCEDVANVLEAITVKNA
ncbi:MAG: DUF47 family protein [Acidobacteria bacterium]|nr:DUF47 family protein [Acidobacteriota bacterium]